MSEAKTKKFLFSLFLIPLAAFFFSALPTNTVAAQTVTDNTSSTWTIDDTGKTITQVQNGTIRTCPTANTCTVQNFNNTTTTYTATGTGGVYQTAGTCGNTVTVTGTPIAGGTVQASLQKYVVANCIKSGDPVPVTGLTAGANFDEAAFTTNTTAGGAGEEDDTTSCTIDGIGWLLCPVIDFGAKIADSALGFLSNNFLETKVGLYATTDEQGNPSPTFSAWQWILGFANIIFVIVFLLIIFSQATGYGISNYGVKKMLPKLIIGVVLINLSFFICQIMVDASNILGYGINHFLDTIAQGITVAGDDDPLSKGSPFGGIATIILTTAGIGLALYAALAFFAPVLVAAIVGLLLIFLFLVARQALIILGIIIAPLAFAAWLLPNTEKLFKRWWSIFVQLLLLFPIIALVFGVSKLVSKIIASVYAGGGGNVEGGLAAASSVPSSGNFIGQVIAAAVLVVPLFAVPFLLKGAISGIPVVGNLAAKGYRNATQGSRKRTAGFTDPAFAGLRAQQRAGVRGFMGRKRSEAAQARRRTFSQAFNDTKRGFKENEESYGKVADVKYDQRTLAKPKSMQGQTHQRNVLSSAMAGQTKTEFETEELEAKATDGTQLQQIDQETLASAQAGRTANRARVDKLGKAYSTNSALLDRAAGTVNPRGKQIALAYAQQNQNDESNQTVKAEIERLNAEDRASGDKEYLEKQYADAARNGLTDRVKAISTIWVQQGAGGTDKVQKAQVLNKEHFANNPQMEQDVSGYIKNNHVGDLKVKNRDALDFVLKGGDPSTYRGESLRTMSATQQSSQTPTALARARDTEDPITKKRNLDSDMAKAMLMEDSIVQDMSPQAIDVVAGAVQSPGAAKDIRKSPTFKRFPQPVQDHIRTVETGTTIGTGKMWSPSGTSGGGTPPPGPSAGPTSSGPSGGGPAPSGAGPAPSSGTSTPSGTGSGPSASAGAPSSTTSPAATPTTPWTPTAGASGRPSFRGPAAAYPTTPPPVAPSATPAGTTPPAPDTGTPPTTGPVRGPRYYGDDDPNRSGSNG